MERARRLRDRASNSANERKLNWLEFLLFDVAGGDTLRLEQAATVEIGVALVAKSLRERKRRREG